MPRGRPRKPVAIARPLDDFKDSELSFWIEHLTKLLNQALHEQRLRQEERAAEKKGA